MKLWNIATIFAFGSSVTADFGSIRSIAEGRDELEAAGFTHILPDFLQDEDGEDWGWRPCRDNGCKCLADSNCNSGRCSKWFKCENKVGNGGGCATDGDCQSGHCSNYFKCESKACDRWSGKINGCKCAMDSHCSSGRCSSGFKCEDKLPNGKGCLEDEDCKSDRCSKWLKCEDKLENGGSCGLDGDCDSGHCSNIFKCENKECLDAGKTGKPNDCSCLLDINCLSRRCSKGLTCQDLLENGYVCLEDADCKSRRCSKGFTCQAQLENGEVCLEDLDCVNRCGGNFKCTDLLGEDESCKRDNDCESDLSCYKGTNLISGVRVSGKCTDYANLLKKGPKGTCKLGSPVGSIKQKEEQKLRVEKLQPWFSQSDADVVMFQEVFTHQEEIITAMTNAGFCYYVSNIYEFTGSGKQIFSKYPLENADFIDFYDESDDPELIGSDRGVMYAKVIKDGMAYHVGNTHTSSNSLGEKETVRRGEYKMMKSFVTGKKPKSDEMVFYGGDMNEDKYNHDVGDKYYKNMLAELDAFEPHIPEGGQQFTYDTYENPIPRSFQEKNYQELLDFVLVSNEYAQPKDASCEILIPKWPLECGGEKKCMISDHFPNVCTFSTSVGATPQEIGETNLRTTVA